MNKIFQLVSGAVLLMLLSASAGYLLRDLRGARAKHAPTVQTSPAARFTLNKQPVRRAWEKQAGEQPGIEALLVRLSRMTPEQLEEEAARIKDWDFSGCGGYTLAAPLCLSYLGYKWGQSSPKRALEWIKETQGDLTLYGEVLRGWAETNPEMAAAYFAEHRDELPYPKQSLQLIAVEMAMSSPDLSFKWLAGLDHEERGIALPALLQAIADTRPEQWAKQIGHLSPQDFERDNVLETVAARWAALDWEAASQWLGTLPDNQKQKALPEALGALSIQAPEKAREEFKKLTDEEQFDTAGKLVRNWAGTDPVKAMEWLIDNTSERTTVFNITDALSDDSFRNPEVKEYISEIKAGPVRDQALEYMLSTASYNKLASSDSFRELLRLTDKINNSKKREDCVKRILTRWSLQDHAKVETWLETSTLPDPVKNEIREKSQKTSE